VPGLSQALGVLTHLPDRGVYPEISEVDKEEDLHGRSVPRHCLAKDTLLKL